MSTTPIPDHVWADFDDDFERFGREAREVLYPSGSTQGVGTTDEDTLWPGGSSDVLHSDPFVPPVTLQPMELDPTLLFGNFQMPAPWMPPATIDFGEDMPPGLRRTVLSVDDPSASYSWKSPLAPRREAISLPPPDPWYSTGGYVGGHGADEYYGDETNNNFPEGGAGDHQGTDVLAQKAGTSTSLAPAKPNIIENDNRSEQSGGSTPSSSRGNYDRVQNEEEKKACLSRIRKALGLPSTEMELPTLQKLIERLEGNVPGREAPRGWITKTQRQARKRAELRKCFLELKNIVSPQDTKLGDLKVLTLALASLTSQAGGRTSSEREFQQYSVFRV